jgi:hypothetical protein
LKDRQHNDQKKKNKTANNDLQDYTHKTKDHATRTSLKIGAKSGAPEEFTIPAPLVTTSRISVDE